MKPFADFVSQFSRDKLAYDLRYFLPNFVHTDADVSAEALQLFIETATAQTLVLLQQYHEWLRDQLDDY